MKVGDIVTVFGWRSRDGTNCVSYVYAVTDYARAHHLGLVYWDYGSTDSWSVATRTGSTLKNWVSVRLPVLFWNNFPSHGHFCRVHLTGRHQRPAV